MKKEVVQDILYRVGDPSSIQEIRPVSGGDISDSYKVITVENEYFVKYNSKAPEDFFQKEAEGLQLLKESNTLRVPKAYGYSRNSSEPGFIAMEWLEGKKDLTTEEQLGRGLAQLHHVSGDQHGLEMDNYIGTLVQPNSLETKWSDFLREKRLGYQTRLAEKQGFLPNQRQKKLHTLLEHLDSWIPVQGKPSLLHGDLWGGNWIAGPQGEPCLIDPAVFFGDREFELAFTELFGGFSRRFYAAYQEVYPISPEYDERKPIYQLYYLLVHLNLFGETYGSSVDRVLSYYV